MIARMALGLFLSLWLYGCAPSLPEKEQDELMFDRLLIQRIHLYVDQWDNDLIDDEDLALYMRDLARLHEMFMMHNDLTYGKENNQ